MAKKTKSKVNFGQRLTKSLIGAGTGAAVQVVGAAVGESDMLNYGMLAVGAALPAFLPGTVTEAIGDGVTAIAGYKIAQSLDLSGKLGLGTPTTTGLSDRSMIGQSQLFTEVMKQKKKSERKIKASDYSNDFNPMGV